MHTKPFLAKEAHNIEWTINNHEGEEEYRQHNHMKKLWHETSEYTWNLSHIFITIKVGQN